MDEMPGLLSLLNTSHAQQKADRRGWPVNIGSGEASAQDIPLAIPRAITYNMRDNYSHIPAYALGIARATYSAWG